MRHVAQNCVAPCICIDTIKNNRNYTVQIKLYIVLDYTFFKPYISKICNDFSLYIYDLNINWISIFALNNSLGTKLKFKWDT